MTFADKIKLDKYRLDENAIEQPSLYNNTAEDWAKSVLERDKAKENLEIVAAKVGKRIRESPEIYGIEKVTEKSLQEAMVQDKEYREASSKLINAQYNVNVLSSAKEAIDHRGKALRILSDLYSGSYFSASAGEKMKETATERTKENQKQGLKENTRLIKLRKKE